MDYDQFVMAVQNRAGIGADAAADGIAATLTTLSERLTAAQAQDVAAELPTELKDQLAAAAAGQPFDFDDFLNRIADELDADRDHAHRIAAAVVTTLAEAGGPGDVEDALAALPPEFGALVRRENQLPAR
jgi:uncharacterized protein (DUF2267 family)